MRQIVAGPAGRRSVLRKSGHNVRMIISARARWVIPFIAVLVSCAGESSSPETDEKVIRDLMMQTWNSSTAPLVVGPVVISGHAAIADWTQPGLGGRALVQRSAGTWSVTLCAGDALREAALLEEAGVSTQDASRLVEALRRAEVSVSPDRLARMTAFQGVTRMSSTDHPHHQP